jgi:predicted XRE-type DNA-binding protein
MSTLQHILQQLKRAGWTQLDIQDVLGIPQPRLSKWYRGRVPQSADDALRLLELQRSGRKPRRRIVRVRANTKA